MTFGEEYERAVKEADDLMSAGKRRATAGQVIAALIVALFTVWIAVPAVALVVGLWIGLVVRAFGIGWGVVP